MPTWQLTNLLGIRPALLSQDDGGWSVLVDGEAVAAPSLDEAVGRALRVRAAQRRQGTRADPARPLGLR